MMTKDKIISVDNIRASKHLKHKKYVRRLQTKYITFVLYDSE